jgi:hypothetical protein
VLRPSQFFLRHNTTQHNYCIAMSSDSSDAGLGDDAEGDIEVLTAVPTPNAGVFPLRRAVDRLRETFDGREDVLSDEMRLTAEARKLRRKLADEDRLVAARLSALRAVECRAEILRDFLRRCGVGQRTLDSVAHASSGEIAPDEALGAIQLLVLVHIREALPTATRATCASDSRGCHGQ